MASVIAVRALQDLKVKLHEQKLVFPSSQQQTTEKKTIFLSNIDRIFNYNVSTVHFFTANPNFPPETVAERLKSAVEKVLVTYDFMGGKLQLNEQSGRLEIDCSGPGAGFVLASSECSIDDLGDLVYPNRGSQQLVAQVLDNLEPGDDQPICIFQVTSFKCGGFAIGLTNNHVLLDGAAAQTLMAYLATQAFHDDGKQQPPLDFDLCHDRRLLAARSPPHVDFHHHEFFKSGPSRVVFKCENEEIDCKIFKLTPTAIDYLKDKALKNIYRRDIITTTTTRTKMATRFGVATALIWRCKALSERNYQGSAVSTLVNTVDIRPRMNPPLPPSYCGNAVLVAYAFVKYEDVEEMPFSEMVEMVAQGLERMSDEYVRSMIDWLEINKGPPLGDNDYYTVVTTWLGMRPHRIVYPWGKPVYSGPILNYRKDICWLFPDSTNRGISAVVSLPVEEMKRFEAYFREFFPTGMVTV